MLQILVFSAQPPPPPLRGVNKAAILMSTVQSGYLSCGNLSDPSVVFYCSIKIWQPVSRTGNENIFNLAVIFVRHSEQYKPKMAAGLPQCFLSEQLIKAQR